MVETLYVCVGCGCAYTHVEVWEGDDEPHGLPLTLAVCEDCGAPLSPIPSVAASNGGDART
jgi:hypothetical protein